MISSSSDSCEFVIGQRVTPEQLGKLGYAKMPIRSGDGEVIMMKGIVENGRSRISKIYLNDQGVITRIV